MRGRKRILSLQQYAKIKRKERVEFLELDTCNTCEFFRKNLEVCLGGAGILKLKSIKCCPITFKPVKLAK